MAEDIKKMPSEKLVELWRKGCDWVESKMQVTGTNKAEDGKDYNHKLFEKGVARIIAIEDELIHRGVIYGKSTSTV